MNESGRTPLFPWRRRARRQWSQGSVAARRHSGFSSPSG